MSATERLASFFLAPAEEERPRDGASPPARVLREVPPPSPAPPRLRPVPPPDEDREDRGRDPAPAPSASPSEAPRTAPGRRVAVVGGGRRGARFAAAVAAALARAPGSRCALLLTVDPDDSGPVRAAFPVGPPTPAARRLARSLAGAGVGVAVSGRVVQLHLEASDPTILGRLATLEAAAAGVPVALALPGVRAPALDPVLARQDDLLLAVAADAPTALGLLAAAELRALAPGAVVRAVTLPARLGVVARRAAVAAALEGP